MRTKSPQLLCVTVDRADAVGVDPAAEIPARTDVREVAVDLVAFILLEQLIGDDRVACFGARVDPVEHVRLLGEIEAKAVEMLVPVRIFDDDASARIFLVRGTEDQITADLAHFGDAVVGPAAIALRRNVRVALGGVEEEVVEDHLVEVPRDEPDGALAFRSVRGTLVIEGPELPARSSRGERYAARCLNAMRFELALHGVKVRVSGELPITIGLDVDLIEFELRGDAREVAVERRRIGQPLSVVNRHVDRDTEVLIGSCMRRRWRRQTVKNSRDQSRDPLQTHTLPLAVSVINSCADARSKHVHERVWDVHGVDAGTDLRKAGDQRPRDNALLSNRRADHAAVPGAALA